MASSALSSSLWPLLRSRWLIFTPQLRLLHHIIVCLSLLWIYYLLCLVHCNRGGTVVKLVELLPHSTKGPGSILTSGSVHVEFACSPSDLVPSVSSHIAKDVQVCQLIGLCKLPLMCRGWMGKRDNMELR